MRAGMQIGQAILDRKLGQGGMAEVWLGHNAVLDTPVAVKFLISPWAGHPELEQRFLNEARRQGALDHPNIVKVYGFEYVEGHSFLIMQYIDGESLDEKLARGGRKPLGFGEILPIATGALAGLDYAHKNQVVHRDIKPSNMMIDRSSHVYISDFGLAMVRDEQRITRTGSLMGTPLYMSPEQILRPKEVDHRADIYSFGCVLYEMFAGRAPFDSEDGTDFSVKMAHASIAPPQLRQFNAAVPADVEAVVMKCLEKNPNDRFLTCGELAEALRKAMPQTVSPPAPAAPSSEDFHKLFEEPSPAPAAVAPPAGFTMIAPTPPPPAQYAPLTAAPKRTPAMPVGALIAIGAVLIASLGGATYYVTRQYFAVKPQSHEESKVRRQAPPDMQGRPQPDSSPPMPQPGASSGPIQQSRNRPAPATQPQMQPPTPQNPSPTQPPPQEPEKQPQPERQQPIEPQLETQPLNNVSFRVKLRSKLSSESSEEGQTITATVLAPASCTGCTMIGVVQKAGRSGFFPGARKSELLFNFHTLRFPDGQMRAVACRVAGFKNSKGQPQRDEEDQKVDAAHAAEKIFITAAAGTVIGAITRRSKEGALQGAAAGATVGVLLTGFTAKGRSMSFDSGSTFELKVSDRTEQSQ